MSRIRDVLKNRNKVERINKQRRKDEIESVRHDTAFKARLHSDMKEAAFLLDYDDVESIIVKVPDKLLGKFGEAMYSGELADFDISQVEGTADKFYIRKKYIAF